MAAVVMIAVTVLLPSLLIHHLPAPLAPGVTFCGNWRCRLVLESIIPWDTVQPPDWFQRWFILANAHPGGILVLHDTPEVTQQTPATLRDVVPELKRKRSQFVDLDTLSGPAGPGSSC